MPVAAPPPSSAPAKAGGSPPAPASTEHEPAPESFLGDLGPELEALDKGETLAQPTRDTKGKFTKEEEKPSPPEEVKPPPEGKPEPKPEEKKPGPFALVRKAKEELEHKRDHEWMPKIQSLEAKVAKYEQELASGPKPFQERVAALEKERDAALNELRFANYQKHPEYVEKFQKPLNEAWAGLFGDLDGFKLELEDGQSRDITVADINQLAGLPLKQRGEQARAWFGESAATILQHIRNIADLSKKNEQALEDARKASEEHAKTSATQYHQQNAAFHQAFTGAGKELVEKYPKWFGESEDDPKGNEMLKKGFEFADGVFNGNGNLTPLQKAQRMAVIRAKAANHDRLAARLKDRDARIAELEETVAEYEESAPPSDKGGEPGGALAPFGGIDDIEAELRKMDKR